ncbi:MAPEG family protein [Jannaschia donghaensis]|nr:MAPEG family protein [Jannaschia donghaensis]
MEHIAPYAHALASLGGWAILMVILLIASAFGTPRGRTESGHPVRDYSDPAYRRSRAFLNAIEISGPFIAATLAAILVGASPLLVNIFASVFLASRVGMAIVHIATEIQPLRSAFWFVGLICCLALAGMAIVGAFAL